MACPDSTKGVKKQQIVEAHTGLSCVGPTMTASRQEFQVKRGLSPLGKCVFEGNRRGKNVEWGEARWTIQNPSGGGGVNRSLGGRIQFSRKPVNKFHTKKNLGGETSSVKQEIGKGEMAKGVTRCQTTKSPPRLPVKPSTGGRGISGGVRKGVTKKKQRAKVAGDPNWVGVWGQPLLKFTLARKNKLCEPEDLDTNTKEDESCIGKLKGTRGLSRGRAKQVINTSWSQQKLPITKQRNVRT